MSRRTFLRSAAAGLLMPLAPAIVRAESLMRVRPVRDESMMVVWSFDYGLGDSYDDTAVRLPAARLLAPMAANFAIAKMQSGEWPDLRQGACR